MNKSQAVESVLQKRFGEKDPSKIDSLLEINTFESGEQSENKFGIGIELIISTETGENIIEEYQVNQNGVIFSWGSTPVIDKKSLNSKF